MMASFGMRFDYVHADLEFGTNKFKDVGVRYKGNGTFFSSRNTLKRSLKVDLSITDLFVKGNGHSSPGAAKKAKKATHSGDEKHKILPPS